MGAAIRLTRPASQSPPVDGACHLLEQAGGDAGISLSEQDFNRAPQSELETSPKGGGEPRGGGTVLEVPPEVSEAVRPSERSDSITGSAYVQYANIEIEEETELEVKSEFCKSARDFVVLDNYEAEIQPSKGYTAFLEDLGFNSLDAEGEIAGFSVFRHLNGNLVAFPSVRGGKLNPWTLNKACRNSASRKLKGIMRVGVPWMGFNVLTFPKGVADRLRAEPESTEAECWEAYRLFSEKLRAFYGGKVGIQANFHGWSSSNPLECHCHLHLDFLGAVVRADRLEELPLNHGRPFDREAWLKMWYDSMSEVFDRETLALSNGSELTPEKVDVYFEWLPVTEDKKPYLLHKLKYRDRVPLVDLSTFFRSNEYMGIDSTRYGRYLVEYKNKARSRGFWTRLKSYCPEDKIEGWGKPETTCPVCGERLLFVGRRWEFDNSWGVVRVVRGGRFIYGEHKPPPQRWLENWLEEPENSLEFPRFFHGKKGA